MPQKHHLEFECQTCKTSVPFSLSNPVLACSGCHSSYVLDDERLKNQIQKFEALCAQIHDSEEILSMASIGVDMGEKRVKIPFKLLLTRLGSHLDLTIGGKPCMITLRFEPLQGSYEK